MIRQYYLLTLSFCALLTLSFAGCGKSSNQATSSGGAETSAPPATVEAGHDHPSEGPHGGSLIELGNEEYHAEMVHDDQAKTVTIYILDSAAKASVPIEAADVTINLKHEGRGEQFKLMASADQNDGQGKASRFVSSDAELAEDLDREGADAELVVTINGKPYRGALAHEHGHGEDEHGHHDE
jgi:hypothetical protein